MKRSNCMIQAIKAKIKDPSVKLIFISPFKNEAFCPHFLWTDGESIFDYHSKQWLRHWWQEFWFEGYIRKRPYAAYLRWKKYHSWH